MVAKKPVAAPSSSFISINEEQQVKELATYLRTLGSKNLTEDKLQQSGSWHSQLLAVVSELKILTGQSLPFADVESLLNGIVSLLASLPADQLANAVNAFCQTVAELKVQPPAEETKLPAASAQLLWPAYKLAPLQNLFHLLPESKLRFTVYLAMLAAATEERRIDHVMTDRLRIRSWLDGWGCGQSERQQLWRSLHRAFLKCGSNSLANNCLLDLMDTYTDADASKARDEAVECIVSTLSDDSVYIMDHLLSLKPISFLEGELIHNLLTIFVSGSLSDYIAFSEKNADFVNNLNICKESCMTKLRLLTLMRLAENKQELDYSVLMDELKLQSDQLEEFIIDAARKEAVFCKIDEVQRKVLVYGTTHRTFGRAQWTSLRDTLQQWRENLHEVHKNLELLTQGGEEPATA